METISFRPGGSVLVFAPHPDDESLACGGLIQRALACDAVVEVVIATDGDANPWPQRVVERRWRLGAGAPERWGRRRFGEASEALCRLGVDKSHVEFLHWPDQGITELLMTDANPCVERLADIIARHRPDLILVPAIHDSHPDHNALGLLLDAALRKQPGDRQVLAYQVHGRTRPDPRRPDLHLALSDEECIGKQEAALAHASQTQFGAGRLLRHVGPVEQYRSACTLALLAPSRWCWNFSTPCPWAARSVRTLQVVALGAAGHVWAVRLDIAAANADGSLRVVRSGRQLRIEAEPLWPGPLAVVAKPDTGHRRIVYDSFEWDCIDTLSRAPSAVAAHGEDQLGLARSGAAGGR